MGPAYAEIRKSGADTARAALGEERFDALVGHGYALPLSAALAVARGEAPAAPAAHLAAGAGASRRRQSLTRREREIAGLVADGLGNREIAEQLFLSKRTVDSHLEHIFTKLGFTSRTQLAAWVLERRERRPNPGPPGPRASLTCAVTSPSQYSSRSGGATFPAVTSRLPSDGKVSACQMTRGPACPGGR